MKDISSVETLVIPSDVTVAIKARKVTVTGPRGTLTKNVGHVAMDIQIVSVDSIGRSAAMRAERR
jgi:large subunit ribosomal protein L9e